MKGIQFGNKHSYNDWGLMLAEFPKISPAVVQKNIVQVPGKDGDLNLTKSLDGFVHFYRRKLQFKFVTVAERNQWRILYSEISNYIHGEEMKIIDDESPESYWLGYCEVGEPTYDKSTMILPINVDAYPFKYDVISSIDQWIWDTFNFETGIIRDYSDMVVTDGEEIYVYGSKMPIRPRFTVSQYMEIQFKGKTYSLEQGRNEFTDIVITDGENIFKVIGSGTLSIAFRGGSL